MKTLQETFDKVAKHLLTQGQKAMVGVQCCYRAGELQCAVGCLIPDELYDPVMEEMPVVYNSVLKPVLIQLGYLPERDDSTELSLLMSLQNVHDSVTVDCWRDALERVARDFQLDFRPDVLKDVTL